ncbi:MAG: hypothetical protein ACFCGT_05015 [Sandaracinaceae bacterium]
MTSMFVRALVAVVLVGLWASAASAQVVIRQDPPPEAPPQVSYPVEDPSRPSSVGPHKFGAFTIGVPLMSNLGARGGVVRPGANLALRGGIDWGYFGVLFQFGAMWIPIDFGQSTIPEERFLGRSPVTRLYGSLGARLQAPHRRITPYAELLFDFNAFNFREVATGCGWWYCTTFNVYRFTPGWTSRIGANITIRPPVAIDVGCSFAFSYPGDFFGSAGSQYWLEPYLGVATRF